jgi:hypothetical protein
MKKFYLFGWLLLLTATAFTASFLETLKLAKTDAESGIWNSFSYGSYAGPMSNTWHNLAVPMRVSLVREIGAFARSYARSEDFASRYAEYRENQKPSAPQPFTGVEGIRKEQREQFTRSIRESKVSLQGQTGEVRKMLEDGIKAMEKALKDLDDPNNPLLSKEMNDMMKQSWDQEQVEYKRAVAAWEKEYPVSPQVLVKKRLAYFLELSATVDFSAKLGKGEEGKMVFLNPQYEAKPYDWKLIYRCGKESVDAARSVAQQWLTEIK